MPPGPSTPSVVDEVLGHIRAQRVGAGTIGDFGLPEAFLRRVADRIIRASFEERHRIVVPDGAGRTDPSAPAGPPAGDGIALAGCVVEHAIPAGAQAARAAIAEERPPLRGYRAPILGSAGEPWPIAAPEAGSDPALVRSAQLVARRLAVDGLLLTTALAIEAIGPARCRGAGGVRLLREVGIPTDLLRHFGTGDGPRGSALLDWIAGRLEGGVAAAGLKRELAAARFAFTPSCAGFRACSESGEGRLSLLRLQITGEDYWGGIGAGGGLDVARQLVELAPDVPVLASVERRFLPGFLARASRWSIGDEKRLRVIPESLPVSQWARDNAAAGLVDRPGADPEHAAMVPRYASRGEDGSVLIPGETFLAEGLAAAGLRVVQSPLLFQGGNLMVVRDPARGERVLLAGEAEVYRNVALGLTEAQATEALRVEMGADRCVVLPAAAFHIDYEVAVRAVGGRLLAFVNDTPAAVAIILSCGIDAMARGGVMAAAEATGAREALASRQLGRAVDIIGSAVMRGAVGPGRFGESFAKLFEAGPGDSGVGNLQRLLLALDLTAAALATPGNMPWDPHARAYLESFRRRDADRRVLWRRLETMGCRIIPVPSLAETPRGVNAVNLIQDSRRVLMPAYGGLYEALDRAAAGVIGAAVGAGTEVVPVRCGESQRRLGALHCASSVYAKP